jgi:hypothetical protein
MRISCGQEATDKTAYTENNVNNKHQTLNDDHRRGKFDNCMRAI